MSVKRTLLVVLLAFLPTLSGCATTIIETGNVRVQVPPITIVGDPDGRRGDAYDSYELFDRADRAFIAGQWAEAERLYVKLLVEYPNSDIAAMARYNLGLALEQTGRWQHALDVYEEFPNPPGLGVRLFEVRMRQGICLLRLGCYDDARERFAAVVNQLGVPPLEHNEARTRLGIAYFYQGDEILARHYLEPALAAAQRNERRGIVHGREAYAEGYFVLGEIGFCLFREIEVTGEGRALAASFHAKADALVAAREYYVRSVRMYAPEWMVASLYRVGQAYELFYRAVLAVPDPEGLTVAEREEYRRQVKAKLQPVIDKARRAYRRNLELAAELHVDNEWVEKTRERYMRLVRPQTGE